MKKDINSLINRLEVFSDTAEIVLGLRKLAESLEDQGASPEDIYWAKEAADHISELYALTKDFSRVASSDEEEHPEFYYTPIKHLHIGYPYDVRLQNLGYDTVLDLLKVNKREFIQTPNVGKKTVEAANAALEKHGLKIGQLWA